jgi:Ran GTPase-activating protein (RanGAP) involved in mRNA processing and transport
VTRLRLIGVAISKGGLLALFEVLTENQVIQVLELYEIQFDSDVIEAMTLFLKRNKSINECRLMSNNLQDRAIATICDALANNMTLEKLYLDGNPFGVEGYRSLGRLLEKNRSLLELHLSDNSICKDGVVALAAGLERNSTLQSLDLWRCMIDDDGAVVMANVLLRNTGLKEVVFGDNKIGTVGMKALANAFKHNRTLENFNISYNSFESSDAVVAFHDLLATSNVSLQTLVIGLTGDSDAIEDILIRNKEQIPAAVRRAALFLIGIRRSTNFEGMGAFGVCPKDVVRLIAMAVWATRKDPVWIQALK